MNKWTEKNLYIDIFYIHKNLCQSERGERWSDWQWFGKNNFKCLQLVFIVTLNYTFDMYILKLDLETVLEVFVQTF